MNKKVALVAKKILDATQDDFIFQDIDRWKRRLKKVSKSREEFFVDCFEKRQEFRSLIRYRAKCFGDHKITSLFAELKDSKNAFVNSLYISCMDIGPGFYIEHGFSTIIFAHQIGENFHVNQNVTIGSGSGGIPTIGNNVSVHCNSVIIGGVSIGNRSIIAAGATVVESVPENVLMASPKAVVVKRLNIDNH